MNKRNRIIYWIATAWLSLGMISTGIVQICSVADEVKRMDHLNYPHYLLPLLGVLKILGVAVVLAPRLPLLKEWAYAGFIFTMVGAFYSHLAMADPLGEIAPSLLLLVLTIVSWYFRPAGRKFQKLQLQSHYEPQG